MKKCLHCAELYASDERTCGNCSEAPEMIDGFVAFAPALADAGGGFRADYFETLAGLEAGNFWFRSRNKIIQWAVETYAPRFSSMLEIGCGTGFVLSGLSARFPGATFTGSEIFTNGLSFARDRLPEVELVQMDARQVPYEEEFDVAGAFDVLEHIKEDQEVLIELYRALKPGGVLIASVPQHAWMWSAADDYACHERRYNARELVQKVENAGFETLFSTSFVSTLFPAMMLSRLINRGKREAFDPVAEFRINPTLNKFFEKCLDFELACMKRGLRFPFGGSRLIVARKPVSSTDRSDVG